MKVCGYCNNEYNDSEPKCPVCGSTLLKHNKHSDPAEAELKRIKEEIRQKRKSRSLIIGIGAAAIIIAIIIAIISVASYITDPQRDIAKESKELLLQAEQQIDNGNYDDAITILNRIDPEWNDYKKVERLRTAAVRGKLTSAFAEYQASGDYETVIKLISQNVSDVNSDPEIKKIYDESVSKYKEAVIKKADEYVSAGDYSSATSLLTTATKIIGEDDDLNNKLLSVSQSEIRVKALEYKNSGDYATAITYINEHLDIVGTESEILLILSDCENAYRKSVLSKAANAYQNDGYQAALAEINAGLSILPDDSELLKEHLEYLACEPISLSDLEPYSYDGYRPRHSENVKDTLGNTYSDAWTGLGTESEGGSIMTYDIGRKYNILAGTIIILEYDKGESGTAGIRIYGDGVLLYENMNITSDLKPIHVEVNVTNVTDLRFELFYAGGWQSIGATICDVTLAKTK